MPSQNRELTGREKQRMKKLITSLCANYDREYGCLPLACDLSLIHIYLYVHLFGCKRPLHGIGFF